MGFVGKQGDHAFCLARRRVGKQTPLDTWTKWNVAREKQLINPQLSEPDRIDSHCMGQKSKVKTAEWTINEFDVKQQRRIGDEYKGEVLWKARKILGTQKMQASSNLLQELTAGGHEYKHGAILLVPCSLCACADREGTYRAHLRCWASQSDPQFHDATQPSHYFQYNALTCQTALLERAYILALHGRKHDNPHTHNTKINVQNPSLKVDHIFHPSIVGTRLVLKMNAAILKRLAALS
ncbi:hypothetical protein CAPTEDRAFT_210983 [Capitella teleta]|uniref:Uncharacterized protein n=1 Tax=Capitella teleta TaxID=283909 RepID=R7V7N2_CAPTE|nr:hypothetical protein CAPTEDRAFT_210983 [Capitella teleta]|eukprot:ELU14559.1 hypothetical protein CAPTEDRAFT_210983 [Capitella teleta]